MDVKSSDGRSRSRSRRPRTAALTESRVFDGCQALQSVGNLGLQLGQGKEQWMEPLHPFIRLSVASVKDFLDKLIDVDHDVGKAFQTQYNICSCL